MLVVHDDTPPAIDAMAGEHVFDHPHEGVERGRIGIDQAHTPEVQVHGSGHVPLRVRVRRPQVEDQRPRRLRTRDDPGEFARRNQQVRVRVTLHIQRMVYRSGCGGDGGDGGDGNGGDGGNGTSFKNGDTE